MVLLDKPLAMLGDSFLNFVYSMAVTLTIKKPFGAKISDEVLRDAFDKSKLSILRKHGLRGNKGTIGNAMEALSIYLYARHFVSVDILLNILTDNLDVKSLGHYRKAKKTATVAFTKVFDYFYQVLLDTGLLRTQ